MVPYYTPLSPSPSITADRHSPLMSSLATLARLLDAFPMTVKTCTNGVVVSMDTVEECSFQLSYTNLVSREEATYCDISASKVQAAWGVNIS